MHYTIDGKFINKNHNNIEHFEIPINTSQNPELVSTVDRLLKNQQKQEGQIKNIEVKMYYLNKNIDQINSQLKQIVQDKAAPDKIAQDKAAQDKIAQDKIAQDNAAIYIQNFKNQIREEVIQLQLSYNFLEKIIKKSIVAQQIITTQKNNAPLAAKAQYDVFLKELYTDQKRLEETNKIFTSDLIFFYKFEAYDEQNGSIKNYATGNYDAILKNGTKITQLDYVVGKSFLLLDGSKSQYLQLPAFTPGSNGLTIAFWFKINKALHGWARLFDFGNGPGNNNWLQAPGNGLAVYNDGGGPVLQPNVSPMVFENNIWYHSVWTLTPAPNGSATSTWKYYINGALIKTYPNGGYPQPVSLTSNYIGKSNWGDHDGYFDGLIGEFRLYNKVLTEDEVRHLYNFTPIQAQPIQAQPIQA